VGGGGRIYLQGNEEKGKNKATLILWLEGKEGGTPRKKKRFHYSGGAGKRGEGFPFLLFEGGGKKKVSILSRQQKKKGKTLLGGRIFSSRREEGKSASKNKCLPPTERELSTGEAGGSINESKTIQFRGGGSEEGRGKGDR